METILENRGSAIHVPRAICRAERGRKDRVAAIEIPRFGQIASRYDARVRWANDEKGIPRKRFAALRDPLVRLIERRLKLRQARREAQHLEGGGAATRPTPSLPKKR